MDRKPHKHAELLKAIADGKAVQYQFDGDIEWFDMELPDVINPLSKPNRNWRIKPEPKPDVVYFCCAANLATNDYLSGASFQPTQKQYPCDNLKLTFDGETKKLKAAEVINDD